MGTRSKGPYGPKRREVKTYRYDYTARLNHPGEGKLARRIRRSHRWRFTEALAQELLQIQARRRSM